MRLLPTLLIAVLMTGVMCLSSCRERNDDWVGESTTYEVLRKEIINEGNRFSFLLRNEQGNKLYSTHDEDWAVVHKGDTIRTVQKKNWSGYIYLKIEEVLPGDRK